MPVYNKDLSKDMCKALRYENFRHRRGWSIAPQGEAGGLTWYLLEDVVRALPHTKEEILNVVSTSYQVNRNGWAEQRFKVEKFRGIEFIATLSAKNERPQSRWTQGASEAEVDSARGGENASAAWQSNSWNAVPPPECLNTMGRGVGPSPVAGQMDSEAADLAEAACPIDASPIEAGAADMEKCVICLVEPKKFIIVPCGHQCLCQDCSLKVLAADSMCPICRGPVAQIMRVFL